MRHTFGTGEWVEAIPLADLRIKHKKKLYAATNSIVPMTTAGEFDPKAVIDRHGSWQAYSELRDSTQLAALVGIVVTAWSWDMPIPAVINGALVNAGSIDEVPLELEDFLAPYLTRLTRDPDPKEVTSSSSNGSSPAKARASQKA